MEDPGTRQLVPAPPSIADEDEDECTDELIDRILENYQFHFKPEIRLKLKQQ